LEEPDFARSLYPFTSPISKPTVEGTGVVEHSVNMEAMSRNTAKFLDYCIVDN